MARQLGDGPPDDVGDRAYRRARARPILRIHCGLVDAWPDSVAAKGPADELLRDLQQKYDDAPDEVADALRDLLTTLSNTSEQSWLKKAANELLEEYPGSKLDDAYRVVGGKSIVLAGRRQIPELAHSSDSFSDEDDRVASGTSHRNGTPVRLRDHLPGVEGFARCHASSCGLPEDLVEAIAKAGQLHDLGKVDARFQSLLHGGARWLGGEPLAKSAQMPKSTAVRENSGYPRGGRHELLSVRLAESAPALLPEDEGLRDLTLHLIASHPRPLSTVCARGARRAVLASRLRVAGTLYPMVRSYPP